jgi:hypothetical protein
MISTKGVIIMKRILLLTLTLILLLSVSIATPATAWTKWDLEGWRDAQGKWMDGLLWEYNECNWVDYRLVAKKYDGLDTDIIIQHDYLNASGEFGIDGAKDFFIGPPTGRTATPGSIVPIYEIGDGVFHVEDPDIVPVPNGWMIEYHVIIDDAATLQGLGDFAIYWKAHCAKTNTYSWAEPTRFIALGSSFWSGASLHTHTDVTGNQDVPIKTPEDVSAPSIEVKKKVYVPCSTYLDADVPPGPILYVGDGIKYTFEVTNTGDVPLTDVELNDPEIGISVQYGDLPVGDSFTVTSDWVFVEFGLNTNTATATGDYGEYTVDDDDLAHYTGKL